MDPMSTATEVELAPNAGVLPAEPPSTSEAAACNPSVGTGSRTLTVVTGLVGNVLEWYDFAVFGTHRRKRRFGNAAGLRRPGRLAVHRTYLTGHRWQVHTRARACTTGTFAADLGTLFFPSEDPTASLMETFAVFGAAFLMRPLGGMIFGYMGDRHGRRRALVRGGGDGEGREEGDGGGPEAPREPR